MLTPLLFPHTYLAPATVAAAAHFFHRLAIYQPVEGHLPEDLAAWAQSGFLDVRVPVPDAGDEVAAAVKEFQQWAELHPRGRDLRTVLPRVADWRPPFFDDHATAQILTDLKAPQAPRPAADLSAERSFSARLFLCLAQNLDQRRRELTDELNRVEVQSQAMLDQLQFPAAAPKPASASNEPISFEKTYEFMLAERLNAWTRLFMADTGECSVLLTTSPSIIADLISAGDGAVELMRLNIEDLPSRDDPAADDSLASLTAGIERAIARPLPFDPQLPPAAPPAAAAADLTLYLFPDQGLRSLVSRIAGLSPSGRIHPHRRDNASRHAVIGLIDPQRY